MQSLFSDALQSWKGRCFLEHKLLEHGFSAHLCYQNYLKRYCAELNVRCDVERFWDEYSEEWVRCAVDADHDRRQFSSPPEYRSQYLDVLFSEYGGRPSRFRFPPLHPCLLAFLEDDRSKANTLSSEIFRNVGVRKAEELNMLGDTLAEWNGDVPSFRQMVRDIAGQFGFEKCSVRKWEVHFEASGYAKENSNGLIFFFGLDAPGQQLGSKGLPLRFSVTHRVEPPKNLWLNTLEYLIPGFEYYSTFDNNKEAALGTLAAISLFDTFCHSF